MKLLFDATTLLSVALLVFAGWRSRWTGRLIVLLLLSPALRYFSVLFTFPIRLQLSAWAGELLRLAGLNVVTEGNVLVKQDPSGPLAGAAPVEMAVDPACMGLQMTGVSLLVALFLLIWWEKQMQKAVPLGWVIVYGCAAFGLTIGSNLFRIVLLVAFGAMPGTVAHDVIGLVCVIVYAWLPAGGLSWLLIRWFGRVDGVTSRPVWSSVGGVGLLAVGLSVMAFAARTETTPPMADLVKRCAVQLDLGQASNGGYRQKTLSNGFVQLTKPGVLIYLKPQFDWFSADHSPMTCWQGSGYELRRVREIVLDGHPAYVGELRKPKRALAEPRQPLYTAWWFTNGARTTISQLTMRRQMLRGETGFVLVNVTTIDEKLLYQEL